jgi:subtilisin family serine protease
MKRQTDTSGNSYGGQEKMDAILRRLLKMTDGRIRADLRKFEKQVATERKKRQAALKAIPRSLSDAERQVVLQAQAALQTRLFPPRHLTAVIAQGVKAIKVRAIVRFTGNRSDLEAMGIAVRSQAQDVFTITATLAQIRQLAGQPACRRLRTPHLLFPTVEEASAQVEVAAVHDPRPLNPTGFRGNGVLVGIIDSALDVTHHGFRMPTGNHDSRALYYWVQSPNTYDAAGNYLAQANPPGRTPDDFTQDNATANPPVAGPNFLGLAYGRLYTQAQINQALGQTPVFGTGNNQICCTPDPNASEHGTHCAGIAAGSGHENNWNTNPTHTGAAPEATLVYVCRRPLPSSMGRDAVGEDDLLDALNFCLRVAQFHNMPIVISVSQCNSFGPHNGEDDFDLGRDNMLNSFDGRSIAWAAGNDNTGNGHRNASMGPGLTDSFTFSNSYGFTVMYLDIWYTGPELDYRITHAGQNCGWQTAGQSYQGTVGNRTIDADRDPEPGVGLRGIRIYVANASQSGGDSFTIELRNTHASQTADYHAWVGSQGYWANLSGSSRDELTLSDSACARSLLTVGACQKVRPANTASGEPVTDYSGAGPTMDGRIKPEIVAVGGHLPPGQATSPFQITSAWSDQNSGYTKMQGTSMATPLVAGGVALLYEAYGAQGFTLNHDTVKALLIQHAHRTGLHLDPAQPGYVATERNRYGNGRLRIMDAIDAALPPLTVNVWIRTADDDYGLEPYPGGCFCGAPDIRVFPQGSSAETTDITWGNMYDVRVTVRNLGDDAAVGTTVRLKYTLPWAAPSDWFEAEDNTNQKLNKTVTVPAMGVQEVLFKWRPEASELGAPAGTTHFCLLAEATHPLDPLVYAAPTSSGGDAWSTNIKATNNVALRNLHIQ